MVDLGTHEDALPPDAGRLKLFISYSRADLAFADELTAGLEYDGAFEVAIDRHSIIEGEDWKKRLGALIADADTVVFLLSPSSAKSDICRWEVDEAVRLTKRIVPVLAVPLGGQPVPSALAALNYVRFDPLDDGRQRSFMAGLKGLVRALKSDLEWLREHTRLLARASEWAEAGRARNRLLTGDAVAEAKAWSARRPKDAPALNVLHLEFIAASEQAEAARQGEAARALADRERLVRQAEQAASEREEAARHAEAAADRERTAVRRSARLQWVASALMAVVIGGLLARTYERELHGLWFQLAVVRPHLVTSHAAIAKKPSEPFWDCAKTEADYSENCPGMVVVPAGDFMMGSPETEKDRSENEGPLHKVTIAAPFAVSMHDVTFDQWDACVNAGGCKILASDAGWPRGRRPVININWNDAQEYATWLSAMTGHPYRLLTEAEWEYSARAGTSTAYSFGDDEKKLKDYSWYTDNSELMTHPVGQKKANPWGLYDMHGNVWQWVQDCVADTYTNAPTDGKAAPEYKKCSRVLRGGSWSYQPPFLRSAARDSSRLEERYSGTGFRIARTLLP